MEFAYPAPSLHAPDQKNLRIEGNAGSFDHDRHRAYSGGGVLGKYALGGFLISSLATGFVLAVTLNSAGGAWDNAKKWIESGQFGGKGSDAHKAAVIGDTTGDSMKDTAGPSLNILLKLMAVISLLFAPVLTHFHGFF